MDYTILLPKTRSTMDEESPAFFSLYEALQELPDPRRAEAETLPARLDPLVVDSGQIGRPKEFVWSNRVAPSS